VARWVILPNSTSEENTQAPVPENHHSVRSHPLKLGMVIFGSIFGAFILFVLGLVVWDGRSCKKAKAEDVEAFVEIEMQDRTQTQPQQPSAA
jgi:hypothetical protein